MKEDTTRLILLGILNRQAMSGYDIKKTLKAHGHMIDLSFSTLYSSMKKLEKEGLITRFKEVESNRPTKLIYSINPKGKEELESAIIRTFSRPGMPEEEFNAALYFSEIISPKELKNALEHRHGELKKMKETIDRCCHKGKGIGLLHERALIHLKAEEQWIIKAKGQLK
ncbi:PadR family transcriptional regulator [Candidatus Woesearchaeota archaeon]|nr:PadR family transcriptional regulator [Candidatus Woesearchaeota archaeon]